MLVVGVVLERGLIRLFYGRPHEDQILVTFGAGIVLVEAVRALFGGNSSAACRRPAWGQGIVQLGFLIYPTYRLELIGIVAALLGLLYLILYRTSIGLVVRAGIEDAAHGRHPRHQRPPRVPSGVRDRRGGGGRVGHAVCADRLGRRRTWARISWWNPSW